MRIICYNIDTKNEYEPSARVRREGGELCSVPYGKTAQAFFNKTYRR